MMKIRKGHVDWQRFLCGIPASDYIFQDTPYEVQIQRAKDMIKNADAVIIGAGAGASTAAGICYSGNRFTDNFAEFIEKYESIAFCCLSTGVFCFPKQRAAEIAIKTVKDFLIKDMGIKKVIFNVFKDEDLEIYSRILGT